MASSCILKTNPETTEMRTSQQALGRVFNENSSAWPTRYSIRARQGRAWCAAKHLHQHQKGHCNIFIFCPNTLPFFQLTYEKRPAAQGIPGLLLSAALSTTEHQALLEALQSVCTTAEAQPLHMPCFRPCSELTERTIVKYHYQTFLSKAVE